MSEKETIHYFTNIAPHYRQRLWELMVEDRDLDIIFYFGKSNIGIKEMDFQTEAWLKNKEKLKRIKNVRLFNRVVWQQGVISKVLYNSINKTLFLGDVNIISTWLAAFILRLKGAKVYYWQHGFSGEEFIVKRYLKILFDKLANECFVYSEFAKNTMLSYAFKADSIHVIYNSLDYDKHKQLRHEVIGKETIEEFFRHPELPLLIFIGRLTSEKKIDLLIKAAGKLNENKSFCNLLIIGDGDQEVALKEKAANLLEGDAYHFYGSCYDEKEIGKLLANADLCVSPGNVGLTAIHSLSFGTPVCTHDNFNNQMPEFEAIAPGSTGFFFKENDIEDLVSQIRKWFNRDKSRQEIRENCYKIIDEKYNPYYQLSVFKKVLL